MITIRRAFWFLVHVAARRLGVTQLVTECVSYERDDDVTECVSYERDDDDDFSRRPHPRVRHDNTVQSLLSDAWYPDADRGENRSSRRVYGSDDSHLTPADLLGAARSIDALLQIVTQALNDWCDSSSTRLYTPEQWEALEQQREYEACEKIAKEFAQSHKVRLGTQEFLDALLEARRSVEQDRDDWNSGEQRAERWAACLHTLGSAYGAEIFCDDTNFERGRFAARLDDLDRVWRWLERNCPLLMAQYQENQLAVAAGETD